MNELSTREILKKMSLKEKISYIWYYYKIHIFSILALLLVVVFFISTRSTNQEIYLDITYVGNTINVDELTNLSNELNQIVLNNDPKKTINIDPVFMDDSSNSSNSQYAQKLMVQFAAKEIDMAIVNKQFFETNYSSNMFLNLETLEGFTSLPISNKDVIKKVDASGNSGIYGIAVKDLNLLNDVHLPDDDYILVVISNSQKTDRALNILKIFLNE